MCIIIIIIANTNDSDMEMMINELRFRQSQLILFYYFIGLVELSVDPESSRNNIPQRNWYDWYEVS